MKLNLSTQRRAWSALTLTCGLLATACAAEPSDADRASSEVVDDTPGDEDALSDLVSDESLAVECPDDAGAPVRDAAPAPGRDASVPTPPAAGDCQVGPVPESVRQQWKLDPFYQKYADAGGIPILSSSKPPDKTLTLACQLVNEMVGDRPDVRAAIIKNRAKFIMIASSEKTTDPPEFRNLPDYYNTRARGLGGQTGMCAEESILCDRAKDRWYGESICVHEYAHTISLYGLYTADKTFQSRLTSAFNEAKAQGLWANTYASEQVQEYWAEGVQNWYDTNLESARPNGVHGPINTKEELKSYDKKLYDLVDELLPDQVKWNDCYRRN